MSSGAPPRLTRAESQARTRSRVLDAAEQLFAEDGYHAATIERIVEQAGFTRGAFYANFADKADLFMTLLEDRNEENLQALREQLQTQDTRDVGAFLEWFDRGFNQMGTLERAYAEFQSVASSTPEHAERLAQRLCDVRNTTTEIINAVAARQGDTLSIPAEDLATITIALVDGYSMQHRIDPTATPLSLLADAVEYLWQAVAIEAD